jgi:hypothetical protein
MRKVFSNLKAPVRSDEPIIKLPEGLGGSNRITINIRKVFDAERKLEEVTDKLSAVNIIIL